MLKRYNAGYFTICVTIEQGVQASGSNRHRSLRCMWRSCISNALAPTMERCACPRNDFAGAQPWARWTATSILPPVRSLKICAAMVQAGGVEQCYSAAAACRDARAHSRRYRTQWVNNWGRIPSWIACAFRSHNCRKRCLLSQNSRLNAGGPDRCALYYRCRQGRNPRTHDFISRKTSSRSLRRNLRYRESDCRIRFYGTFPRMIDHYVREKNAVVGSGYS